MSYSPGPVHRDLIACARCAISKSRCDRRVPCSQCVAKNHECQPRWTSRRSRPQPKLFSRMAGSSPNQPQPGAGSNALVVESPLAASDPLSNDRTYSSPSWQEAAHTSSSPTPAHLESSGFLSLPDEAFLRTPDFIGGHTGLVSGYFPQTSGISSTGGGDTTNMDAGISWFIPENLALSKAQDTQMQTTLQMATPSTPFSLPTPSQTDTAQPSLHTASPAPLTISQAFERWPFIRCNNLELEGTSDSRTPGNALGDLEKLFEDPTVWQNFTHHRCEGSELLDSGSRDRLVAAVQVWLYRALHNYQSYFGRAVNSSVFGPVVVLPPSNVLVYFVEIYAARIEPYLGVAASPRIRIHEILQVNMADVGSLLVTILIAQGAMLADHSPSVTLADGLTEVCKPAVSDILASRNIAESMVGGSALQLLVLCAWSGRESFSSYALSKRGQYMSMLEPAGLLRSSSTINSLELDAVTAWKAWKEQEQRNRLAYAWVYVDLEISLLYDVSPMLSISDLEASLPSHVDLWHIESPEGWLQYYKANESGPGREAQSLNSLFRSFVQGRLTQCELVPCHHLRLLLYPLQSMALEQQQLLRVLGKGEPSNRHRVLSKFKIIGRLQETQDLLQQMSVLLMRNARKDGQAANLMNCVTMIILHLISLNTLTSIPEIEGVARQGPPQNAVELAETWNRVRYAETPHSILFHAGQIFRLIEVLPSDFRPPWWPVAVYRSAMACWSFSTAAGDPQQGSPQPEISINTAAPDAEELDRYLHDNIGSPVFSFRDGRRLPALEGNNSLVYCISLLGEQPTRLVRGVQAKVELLLQRWSP